MQKSNNILLAIILALISLAIISALAIENLLDHTPCKLCLYERIPYFLSVPLIITIFFFKKYEKIILLVLFLTFFSSAILALYHFGIEKSFFNEPLTCTTNDVSKTLSKEQLLEQLKQNTISCKDVNFEIFGLSLATINAIFSICLSVIFARLFIIYEKN